MRKNGLLRIVAILLFGGIFFLSFWGCVSKGTYLEKEEEARNLDLSLKDAEKQYAELAARNTALLEQIKLLTQDLSEQREENENLLATKNNLEDLLQERSQNFGQTIAELRKNIEDLHTDKAAMLEKMQESIAKLETENQGLGDKIIALQMEKEEKVQQLSSTYESLLSEMQNEIARGEITISELKGKLTVNMVDAILFDSGKAEVKPEGLQVLQRVIDILKSVTDKAIRVEGHTDNVPIGGVLAQKYQTNWELSAARAINVTRFLQQQGIDAALLAAVAYGEYKPVADNSTQEGKARNRRIEIVLVAKE